MTLPSEQHKVENDREAAQLENTSNICISLTNYRNLSNTVFGLLYVRFLVAEALTWGLELGLSIQ
jgi:hypothetical protein